MKYLVNRNAFVRNVKTREISSDFLREKAYGLGSQELITEVFENDVRFVDSLVGRLINHIIRKAKVALDMVRIQPVIMRLRSEFDRLMAEGMIVQATPDQLITINRLKMSAIFEALCERVDNNGNVGVIKNLTDAAIKVVNEIPDQLGEELNKKTLAKELNDFKKFLEQFKDDEGGPIEEEEEGEEEQSEQTGGTDSMIVNFSHLFNIMVIYQGIKRDESAYYQSVKAGKAGAAGSSGVSGSQGVSGSAGTTGAPATGVAAGQQQTAAAGTGTNDSRLHSYQSFMSINEAGVANTAGKVVGAVLKFFRGGKDEKKPDPQTLNLLKALKPLWDLFNTDKGVLEKDSELHKFLKNPEAAKSGTTYNKFKSNIDKIYGTIKASGAVKEGVHDLLSKNEQIGKLLVGIYNVTKTKPNGEFPEYPGVVGEVWDELCEEIAKFNETMPKAIEGISGKAQFKEGDTVTWTSTKTGNPRTAEVVRVEGGKLVFKDKKGQEFTKNAVDVKAAAKAQESSIRGYERFLMLLEAEGQNTPNEDETPEQNKQNAQNVSDDALNDPETGSVSERIKLFFDKNCKTVRQYVLDRTEFDKMSGELDKLQNEENFVIDGLDPVMQIVRLFNRAYKIYMTNTITMRSGGKVDPMTFNEYEAFGGRSGGGELNGWAGPFRNKRVFNQWEDAVLKLMADKKYQFMFSPRTKMRFPKVANPKGPEDYEYRDGAGAKLRTFMTDILDGQDLYRDSDTRESRGAQATFLERYFGKIPESEEVKDFTFTPEEAEANSEIAGKVINGSKKLSFRRLKAEPKAEEIKRNMFIVLKCDLLDNKGKVTETEVKRYIKVEGERSIMFANTFYYFKALLERAPNKEPQDASKRAVDKGELDVLGIATQTKEGAFYQMKYAKSKGKTLYDLIRKGKSIKIKYVTGNDKDNTKEESLKIIDVYWLTQEVEGKNVPYEGNWDPEWERKNLGSKIQFNTNCEIRPADVWLNKNNTDINPL